MATRFGPALLAITLVFGTSTAITSALAAPLHAVPELLASSKATDIGSRRSNRHAHSRYAHSRYANPRYSRPHYYDRPSYYRPYPYYVPAPFVFGFGPWW
jgi:hypothetical protein